MLKEALPGSVGRCAALRIDTYAWSIAFALFSAILAAGPAVAVPPSTTAIESISDARVARGELCPPTPFDAAGVELLSWVCLAEFQAFPGAFGVNAGNDIWGYTSPSGREYALMGFDGSTGFVEITDPENPEILVVEGHLALSSIWSDLKTYGERAYVVTDGNGGGLQIFDLSQIDDGIIPPATIYTGPILNRFTTAHNLAIDEEAGVAYIIAYRGSGTPGNGFMALDLTANSVAPPLLGKWHARDIHDMQVVTYDEGPYAGRQIAFVSASAAGFCVLDVTGGQVTELAMDLTYPGISYCHQAWISPDRKFAFVGDELDEGGSTPTSTAVFDISDLDDVHYFGEFTSSTFATDHNLMVRGAFVYEANYRSGLRIFDISDMSSIENVHEVAYFDTHPGSDQAGFAGAWGVYAAFPSGTVIVSDMQRGLFVLDPVAAVDPVYEDATSSPVDDVATSRGAAWGDADGDGDEDLFVANEDAPDRLFRNDAGAFVDVSPVGRGAAVASHGAAWGDMDEDGDLDLYVAVDDGANVLWRNDAGTLVDVSAPPVADIADSRSVSWVDVDRDGDLDLFVANRNDASRIFLNDGAGAFTDSGILGADSDRAMGAAWADYDRDGDQDLALARVSEPNHLYRNEGDGTFSRSIVDGGVPFGVSVGVTWGDYDRDGDFDLYFANAGMEVNGGQANTLLRNVGGTFIDVTDEAQLSGVARTLGAAWADSDRDGWLDLYVSDADDGLTIFSNQDDASRFTGTPAANFQGSGLVYGFALADYDDDGDLDVYAPNATGANHLYRHNGQDLAHWLTVGLEGSVSNARGIGAVLELWSGGVRQTTQITAGSGYLAQHGARAHFGLGAASTIDSLVVVWPSGWRSHEAGITADQQVVLSELDATPIDDHPEPLPPGVAPQATRLYAAVPNPFNPRTRIVFDLERPAAVRLTVYDPSGRAVRTLLAGEQRAVGRHQVVWDGRDASGRRAASGTYFYRLDAGGVSETRRVVLVK